MEKKETRSFQAETKKLLDLMIHSIYTNREIFLRELISNASDALDKLKFKSLTDSSLADNTDLTIEVKIDKKMRSLSVIDNGIGMTYDEIVDNLGTIAQSGSKQFLDDAIDKKDYDTSKLDLIGQFGVGFYSSFMVAKRVVVMSKSPYSDSGIRWESSGDGTYTIENHKKSSRGTTVIIYFRENTEDDTYDDFLEEYKIEQLVKKYSDYIRYPIHMAVKKVIPKSKDESESKENKEKAEQKTEIEIKTLNSMKSLWQRDKNEVKMEEYKEFYQHTFHDWNDLYEVIHTKAEGTIEYTALLFLPKKAPFDFYSPEYEKGLQLYTKNVFIMDKCKEVIPDYFKFVKGLIDSPDFSLNISREILQQTRQLKVIGKNIEKKIFEVLLNKLKNNRNDYEDWFKEFGVAIKSGVYSDFIKEHENLRELLVFYSTKSVDKMTTLDEYISRMKSDQDAIYYISGKDKKSLEKSPQIEYLREKDYEVLFFTEKIDEFMVINIQEYKNKKLKSASRTDSTEKKEKSDTTDDKEFLDHLKTLLDNKVSVVRHSTKLKDSAVCLISGDRGISLQMEQVLSDFEKHVPKAELILEINPNHPIYTVLKQEYAANKQSEKLKDYIHILFVQSQLLEGIMPEDPVAYVNKVADIMSHA